MKSFLAPSLQVLICETVLLQEWGRRNQSFRAPFWRLYRNEQSGAAVVWKGRSVKLEADQIYLIPPETDFSPDLRAPVRHFYLHFVARPPFDRANPGIYGQPVEDGLLRHIAALDALDGAPLTAAGAAQASLHAWVLVQSALANIPTSALQFHAIDSRVERAQMAIASNLKVPLSNRQLAGLVHMTPNAFVTRFSAVVGESPQQYARRIRVEQACVLLHTTDQSMEQIADATGFCDRYHFTRVFAQVRGVSPAVFRCSLG